ncbi:MAG: LicD family protein [Bacteroidetes bacterium]|nr:LicD family protein [Bacteroidota bacterium]
MKHEDFDRYNGEGTDLRKMQMKMLDILDVIVEILNRNDIPYWIEGGTLLGAVRHGGFIPWDDDIDIDVPSRYYKKARVILKKELPDDMILQYRGDDGYKERWIKVRDKYSIIEEKEGVCFRHKGIFVDIFEARSIGRKEHHLKRTIDILIRKYRREGRRVMRTIFKVLYHCVTPFFVLEKKTLFMSDDIFVRWAFPLSLVETLGVIKFENKIYNAPNDIDKYLKIHYGDYMRLPAEDERENHAISITFLEK